MRHLGRHLLGGLSAVVVIALYLIVLSRGGILK
jgi:hypothetical protein